MMINQIPLLHKEIQIPDFGVILKHGIMMRKQITPTNENERIPQNAMHLQETIEKSPYPLTLKLGNG
jgi:hypothetical protein